MIEQDVQAAETARMVREEVILRPARRAAAFAGILAVALTAPAIAGSDSEPPAGFEIRPEIAAQASPGVR